MVELICSPVGRSTHHQSFNTICDAPPIDWAPYVKELFQMWLQTLMPMMLAILGVFPSGFSLSDSMCYQQLKVAMVIIFHVCLSFHMSHFSLPTRLFVCWTLLWHSVFWNQTKGWGLLSIPLQPSGRLCLGSWLPWRQSKLMKYQMIWSSCIFGIIADHYKRQSWIGFPKPYIYWSNFAISH